MNQALKYEKARFTEDNGTVHAHPIYAKNLGPNSAKTYEQGILADWDNPEIILFIRPSKDGTYHFHTRSSDVPAPSTAIQGALQSSQNRKDGGSYEDNTTGNAHNLKIEKILKLLTGPARTYAPQSGSGTAPAILAPTSPSASTSYAPNVQHLHVSIYTKVRVGNGYLDQRLAIFDNADYAWAKEATRYMGRNSYIRNDLFGHSVKPEMSIRRPNVAIEVVRTHAPSEQTLSLMFEATLTSPLIVLFDFIECKLYRGLPIFEAKSKERLLRVRCTIYILHGVLYDGDTPLGSSGNPAAASAALHTWAKLRGASSLK
jgi:hypothetical protein